MKKIVGLVVIVLAVIVIFALSNRHETSTGTGGNQSQGEGQSQEENENGGEVVSIKLHSQVRAADLDPVDGSDSSGRAYIVREGGGLVHLVEADMPDPAAGSVYEGWLVQTSPLRFFSTGVMERNSNGMWVLEYSAGQEYPTYNRVVITEETVVDETPETHIIEGDF